MNLLLKNLRFVRDQYRCSSRRIKATKSDTIAAIATPPGRSALATIRLSGPDTWPIMKKAFRPSGTRSFPGAFSAFPGFFTNPATGDKLDQVVVTTFTAPASYTGEDLAEISTHGNRVVISEILEVIFHCGARAAEPGEFTRRAFLNGKMDLLDVEAVAQIIDAVSPSQVRVAMNQISGGYSREISLIREELLEYLVKIEAGLNFPEDVAELFDLKRSARDFSRIESKLVSLSERAKNGILLSQGLNVTLFGRPNCGKSSILNAILGKNRAIVNAIPGTTRDTIEEPFIIEGIPLKFIDTAGLRTGRDCLEAEGISRTYEAFEKAYIVVAVFDASETLHKDDFNVIEKVRNSGRHVVYVLNKIDLPEKIDQMMFENLPVCRISALTGECVPELISQIGDILSREGLTRLEQIIVLGSMQIDALNKACDAVSHVRAGLNELYEDMLAIELEEAVRQLGLVTGETVGPDILNRIFDRFCIGK